MSLADKILPDPIPPAKAILDLLFADLHGLLPDLRDVSGALADRLEGVLSIAGAGLSQTAQALEAGAISGVSGQLADIAARIDTHDIVFSLSGRIGVEKKS